MASTKARIRQLVKDFGTAYALAQVLQKRQPNFHERRFSDWTRDGEPLPSLDSLRLISDGTGYSVDWLLGSPVPKLLKGRTKVGEIGKALALHVAAQVAKHVRFSYARRDAIRDALGARERLELRPRRMGEETEYGLCVLPGDDAPYSHLYLTDTTRLLRRVVDWVDRKVTEREDSERARRTSKVLAQVALLREALRHVDTTEALRFLQTDPRTKVRDLPTALLDVALAPLDHESLRMLSTYGGMIADKARQRGKAGAEWAHDWNRRWAEATKPENVRSLMVRSGTQGGAEEVGHSEQPKRRGRKPGRARKQASTTRPLATR